MRNEVPTAEGMLFVGAAATKIPSIYNFGLAVPHVTLMLCHPDVSVLVTDTADVTPAAELVVKFIVLANL
jgi:hypothetical protein